MIFFGVVVVMVGLVEVVEVMFFCFELCGVM